MKYYVTRDKNDSLYFSNSRPIKSFSIWEIHNSGDFIKLDTNMFPEVKWEDKEPTEVELIIRRDNNTKNDIKNYDESHISNDTIEKIISDINRELNINNGVFIVTLYLMSQHNINNLEVEDIIKFYYKFKENYNDTQNNEIQNR